MSWIPPGQVANRNLWRYDLGRKSYLPPGERSSKAGTQVEMPEDFTGREPSNFHLLASPAGTQAPPEHINYTPETGEIHGRGERAPIDLLNYTLLPEHPPDVSGGLGMGHGAATSGIAQGMGMGAGAVPALAALGGQTEPFAGTPPLVGGPFMQGPSPTTNRAAPTWGGGGTPFDTRMGMGADDDIFTGTQPVGGTTPAQPASTSAADSPFGQAGEPSVNNQSSGAQPVPATPAATTATTTPVTTPAPPGAPPGAPPTIDPATLQRGQSTVIYGADGKKLYDVTYVDDDLKTGNRVYKYNGGDSKDPTPHYIDHGDGTFEVVTLNPDGTPRVEPGGTVNDTVKAKILADLQASQANAAVAQARSDPRVLAADLATAQANAQTANFNAQAAAIKVQQAAIELANQGKPKAGTRDRIIDDQGYVWDYDPDQGTYVNSGIKSQVTGTWHANANIQTGMNELINPDTQQVVVVSPIDWNKEHAPVHSGDVWIQPNRQTGKMEIVWTDKPDYTTTWAGDQLIATNKYDPKDVQVVYTKQPTQADTDAHNLAVQNIAKIKQDLLTGRIDAAAARVKMEQTLQGMLHPQPQSFGSHGSYYLPPGGQVDVEHFDPGTGRHWTTSESGGPADPRIAAAARDVDRMIGGIDWSQFDTQGGKPQQTGTKPTQEQGGPQTDQNAGDQLATAASPPSTVEGVGDQIMATSRSHRQQEEGDLSGWQPRSHRDQETELPALSLPSLSSGAPQASAVGGPSEDVNWSVRGRRRGVMAGNEGRLGAGMAAGTTGWTPRSAVFAPATGPGFLGGAGAENRSTTFDPKEILGGITDKLPWRVPMPGGTDIGVDFAPPLPGGHQQGPDVPLPTDTDQGTNWVPDQGGTVASRVNEPLGEIMGWPKIEHTPPPPSPQLPARRPPQHGLQGGFNQPEILPRDIGTGEQYPPQEPSDEARPPNVRDLTHILGQGGMTPEEWQAMEQEEGMGTAVSGRGKPLLPGAKNAIADWRIGRQSTGAGQDGILPTPPQGMAGQEPLPEWLQTLLQKHPELLQQAGLGSLPTGGSAGVPPTPGAMPPSGQPAGTPPSSAGWTPPTGQQSGMPPPVPGPGGGPMQAPLPEQDVAGIGHRFGQEMNVGEPQHSGVDLQAPEGTPTKSPVDGFVQDVQDNPQGLGVTVIIKGIDGSEHRLGHLKSTSAYRGMQVTRGQDLGSPVGETGMTTGAHLHWGVRDGQGQPQDPTAALGSMASMPPVPGTEMMGPPGGTGGQAQMGGGQDYEGMPWLDPRRSRMMGELGVDRGWLGGARSVEPEEVKRRNPLALPGMGLQDITPGAMGTGQQGAPMANPNEGDGARILDMPGNPQPGQQESRVMWNGVEDRVITFEYMSMGGTPTWVQVDNQPYTYGLQPDEYAGVDAEARAPEPKNIGQEALEGAFGRVGEAMQRAPSEPQGARFGSPDLEESDAAFKARNWPPTRRLGDVPQDETQTYTPAAQEPRRVPSKDQGWAGGGQDTPDQLWDKEQTREQQGAMSPTLPPHDLGMQRGQPQQPTPPPQQAGWPPRQPGAGSEMGAGGMMTPSGWREDLADTPQNQQAYGVPNSGGTWNGTQTVGQNFGGTSTGTSGDTTGKGKLGIDPGAEAALANQRAQINIDDRREQHEHEDRLAQLAQELQIHNDTLAYQREVLAENARHNQAQEGIDRRRQDIDLQIAQLDSDTKLRIEAMSEAFQIQLEQMKEGQQVLMEKGTEAFKDWQQRQNILTNILSSALKNPWLQQLSGMAPVGGQAAIMGGGNIAALIQKILAPYDYSSVFGGQAPGSTDALNQAAGGAPSAGGATQPGQETQAPDWATWQAWSPFQKAAYRTDIEALGPGAWETQQAAAQQKFTQQGGTADITQLAGQSATPEQSIGQQMNAEMFGQTPQQWATQQQKQWSAAQAPQVKQSQGISATGPTGAAATPEQQFGL